MRTDTWFLLYGGSSVDGRGPGIYKGRTADESVAREHHSEISKDPYSTGYVLRVTDSGIEHIHGCSKWTGKNT